MTQSDTTLYCANHPSTSTSLRCNRCDKPICAKCAVRTPTGYRCRECINNQQKIFETALWYDYLFAFGTGLVLAFLGSILISILPIAFLTILIAPLIGTGIGEAIRLVTQKHRSRALTLTAITAIIIGPLPIVLFHLTSFGVFTYFSGFRGFAGGLLPLIWQIVYIFLAGSSAFYRISGIRIRY